LQSLERNNKELFYMYHRHQKQLDEIWRQGATQQQLHQEPASGDPSHWRSRMSSTWVEADEAPMDHYPMDDIRDKTNCELHQSMKNIPMKVAVGFALPCEPGVRWHGREIRAGYAHVRMDKLYRDMSPWSLTSLDLKRRQHLEKSWVVSIYGIRKLSCFQDRHHCSHGLL
jgi:hypothetical protein